MQDCETKLFFLMNTKSKGLFNILYAPSIPVPDSLPKMPNRPLTVWKGSINKKF